MIALDSGVVVAAFASWHEAHGEAIAVLRQDYVAVGHVLVEAYSVLTRLPPPHRASASLVGRFLSVNFPGPVISLDGSATRSLLLRLPELEIAGGAVYDALIGATAASAAVTLVTLDRRALSVYQRVGCTARLL